VALYVAMMMNRVRDFRDCEEEVVREGESERLLRDMSWMG
jgi:hypothetical protein